MKATVCELSDDPVDFEKDWERLRRHVRRESSELVLLPEMPFYPWFPISPKFDSTRWKEAVAAHNRWLRRLPELAPATVLGSRPSNRRKRRVNEGFVWTEAHGLQIVHTKSYLPNHESYYEASWYDRGRREFVPFSLPKCRIGFMICTDIWAFWHAREYGKKGVHLIVVPRVTRKATREKWLAAGIAVSMVSGAYCLSSNRTASSASDVGGGFGWIVGPDGDVLGLTSRRKPIITAEIDLQKAVAAKKTYPRYSLLPD